uniref:Hemopexin n=1 Tax=Oryzias sinensis TaxID=183150 RepID=A0A8C7YN27_9TELE
MALTFKAAFLALMLALTRAAPFILLVSVILISHPDGDSALPDRCAGIEFDAITPDDKGQTFFFKGDHVWKGFEGDAQPSSQYFKELNGHVDAAFRMHNPENQGDHDHIYLFLDDKVFSYFEHTLEEGYPKEIQEDFPGVPTHLDAAVECPKGECVTDSVLFFKGPDVHVYDIVTKTVKTKTWPHLPACTSVFRWLEHYYCFHGHNFTRFQPVTGEVTGNYPKDARRYFMRCPDFGHGGERTTLKCSDFKMDAITTDDTGRMYMFKGSNYMRLDTHRDGLHAFPITRSWKELTNGVDAVFSYNDRIYLIKGDQVYIYKAGAHFTLIEGYPKTLKEELNIEGQVDAAFVCPGQRTAHIIQGRKITYINLAATPREITLDAPLPFGDIDAAFCLSDGIKIFQGSNYYHYDSPMLLVMSRIAPIPLKVTSAMVGCED